MKPLFIPLTTKYFLQFSIGAKTVEYRVFGPRWNHLTCRIGREVTLSKGYGKYERLRGTVHSFEVLDKCPDETAWRECYSDMKCRVAAIEIDVIGEL